MKKRFFSLAAALAVLLLSLNSCGGSGSQYAAKAESANGAYYAADEYADYDASWDAGMMAEPEEAPAAAPGSAPAQSSSSKSSENDLASRKIIKNARIEFETTTYDRFLESLNEVIASWGGYVESSETYGGGVYSSRYSSRSASVTARIPADRYDGFISSVCGLGAVTYRTENQQDVTMSYVDIESHVRALETEYEALIEILSKAESLEDVILLQQRISEINYEKDSYQSQLRKYDDLISYCTVRLTVNEVWRESTPDEKTLTFGERIVVGLRENFADIGEGAADFAVWFVTGLPYLLIWAAVIVLIVLIIRAVVKRHRRKRDQKLLEAYLNSQPHETEEKKTDTVS
ncbi:MAG: DUF4349 domain-containing protein [Clostridia bacterium]|nr:DUF4349 domain-containing protein [Clostridia bacterium]